MSALVPPEQFDQQITEHEAALKELKEAKAAAEKKAKALDSVIGKIDAELEKGGATREDMFARMSVKIGDWLTSKEYEEFVPELQERLEKHYAEKGRKRKAAGKRRVSKARSKTSPANSLPTGVYRNPLTQEEVTKKTRAPKLLMRWVAENGPEKVENWRVEED